MAKRLNYQIGFSADTSSLDVALNKVYLSLTKLGNTPHITTSLHEASAAALELRRNLEGAVNTSTGQLDLKTFNDSLQRSGRTLVDYKNELVKLGPAGQLAFLDVASAITKAELPLRRSNKLLSELWITMKNTMRWQLTSSMLHGFIGSILTAYGYALDLNESLNGIRIVTLKSAEDMANFAKLANDAAKILSTTTTDYTDASLIYYQLGLNDLEVQDRTDTTIRLANVAGETAETASEQLTAIWNNFYDGGKALEYYADVMVALGASTASSSEEIATGILKFAAVADTVGLSYEYAAAALATVTATTRQSADVVGTALRTLFARIQGLNLGETLDDGTTLNKYSEALDKVGVKIFDTNNELKGMDTILDELGDKWDTLSKDQLVALAETVAGVRQYTQLIALMDNWDFFEENLSTAYSSTGALSELAAIYAESWEAARDRVRASAEDIYDSLINPDFFIGVDNVLAPILSGTADVIDAMGGMQGVLATLALLMNRVYGDKIAQSMRNMVTNLGFVTQREQERTRLLQLQAAELARALSILEMGLDGPESERILLMLRYVELLARANAYSDTLNDRQKDLLKTDLDRVRALQQLTAEYETLILKAEQRADRTRGRIEDRLSANVTDRSLLSSYVGSLKGGSRDLDFKKLADLVLALIRNSRSAEDAVGKLITKLEGVSATRVKLGEVTREFDRITNGATTLTPEMRNLVLELDKTLKPNMRDSTIIKHFDRLKSQLSDTNSLSIILKRTLEKFLPEGQVLLVERFVSALLQAYAAERAFETLTQLTGDAIDTLNQNMDSNSYKATDWADTIVAVGSGLSRLAMAVNGFRSIGRVFSDDDLSAAERFTTLLIGLGTVLPAVTAGAKALNTVLGVTVGVELGAVVVTGQGVVATTAKAAANTILAATEGTAAAAAGALTAQLVAQLIVLAPWLLLIGAVVAAGIALEKVINKDADAAEKAALLNEKLVESYNNLKTAYEELITTISEYQEAVDAIDLTKGIKEYEDALEAANEKAKALLDSNKELLSSARRDSSGLIIIDGLEDYLQQLARYTSNAELASYIAQQRAHAAQLQVDRNEVASSISYLDLYGSLFSISDSDLSAVLDSIKKNNGLIASDLDQFTHMSDELKQSIMEHSDDLIELANSMDTVADANRFLATEIANSYLGANNESFRELGSAELAAISSMSATVDTDDIYSDAINKYNLLWDADILKLYAEAMGYSTTTIKNNWGTGTYYDDQGNVVAEKVDDAIVREYLALMEVNSALLDAESEFYQKAEQSTLKLKEAGDSLGEGLGDELLGFINGRDTTFETLGQFSPDLILSIKNNLASSIEGVVDEDIWKNMGYDNAQAYIDAINAALETYNPDDYRNYLYEVAAAGEAGARNLISEIQSGDVDYSNISENEDYTALLTQLDKLKDEYPELLAALLILSENWEVGTLKFIEALEIVQDRLAQIELEGLAKEANEAGEVILELLDSDIDLTVEANLEEFETAMDDLLNKQYAIDVEVHTLAEQEFDSIVGAIDDIREKASLIGENFVVAAEDVRQLNNTFPGILEGLTSLNDGTVLLSKESVNMAIEAAEAEVAADSQATVAKLENMAESLRVKEKTYRQMAEAATILAGSEVDSDELAADARAVISDGLATLEQENSKIATETMMTHSQEEADASLVNAGITADNWSEGFRESAKASAEFARVAIANMQAVSEGNADAIKDYNYLVNYKGASGLSSEASVIQETQDILDNAETATEDAWAEIAAKYLSLADAAGAAANDIDGMLYEIGARDIDLGYLLDGIRSGRGDSSGGSDNSGKTYDAEAQKTLEDVEDRYHEINREIARQDSLLSDINESIDRAYGTDKLAAYERELEELSNQQDNYNLKLLEAENYLKTDKAALDSLFGSSIAFDENGEILGYLQVLENIVSAYNNNFLTDYNNFLATYSALSKDEQEARLAEYDSWEKQKTVAEELYNARIAALEQYESTLDTIQELRDSLNDLARLMADERLSHIEYRLEVVVTAKTMRDAVRELTKEIAESFGDLLTHGIESAKLNYEGALENMSLLKDYQENYSSLLEELAKATDLTDIDRIMGDLEDLQGQAISTAEALLSWIESIETLLPDAIDDASARFELFTNQLEHNESILDTITELYALQGVSYRTMLGFNLLLRVSQERLNAQVSQAQLLRTWFENARAALLDAEAALVGVSETDAAYDTLKNNRDALLAEYNEALSAMLSAAQSAMQTAQEMYLLAIEKAAYDFGQVISDGMGLDLLLDKYDHYIETEERYLDKVNEAYLVSSWYNKLLIDIDKTSNTAMLTRLKALQDEIDMRRLGGKLSQYDLDILEAKYKVLLALMELEDALNNKNQLRLVRDRLGNWNYQYTADLSAIADAELNLLGAENDWYNIAKQLVTDVTGEIISTWQECLDSIQEIYSDMTLTDEERANRAEEIYAYYTEKIKSLEEEKLIAIADMTEAGNKNLIDMALILGDEVSDLTGLTSQDILNIIAESGASIIDLLTSDNETIKDIIGSNTELVDLFDNVFAKDLANMTINASNFESELQKTLEKAEIDFENYQDTVASVADETGASLDDLREYIDDVSLSTDICRDSGLDAADAMWLELAAVQELSEGYAELADSVYEYIRALRDLANSAAISVGNSSSSGSSYYDANTDYSALIQYGIANGLMEYGDAIYAELVQQREAKIDGLGLQLDYYKTRGDEADSLFASVNKGDTLTGFAADRYDSIEEWLEAAKKLGVLSFSTGGYTGDFSNAKLALLHEKELVLNLQDSANILAAVNSVRALNTDVFKQIEKVLDGNMLAAMGLLASKLGATSSVSSVHDTIEQTVTIERVEFPNVTSSDEIKDAFNSLINDASQWARRKTE